MRLISLLSQKSMRSRCRIRLDLASPFSQLGLTTQKKAQADQVLSLQSYTLTFKEPLITKTMTLSNIPTETSNRSLSSILKLLKPLMAGCRKNS
jgi:hypothetical protein